MNNYKIGIERALIWHLKYSDKVIGTFEYSRDDKNRVWLSDCFIEDGFQRQGLGSLMIKKAVEFYGVVYLYKAEKIEMFRHGPHDPRYLTDEGKALAKACLKSNIIKSDWWINPWD